MPKPTLRPCFAATFLLLAGALPSSAQTNAPTTNAPAATAPAPVALADVVTEAQAASAALKSDLSQISPDTAAQAVRDDLADQTHKIDQRLDEDKRFQQSSPSLGVLQSAQTAWQSIADALSSSQITLSDRVRNQHALLATLADMDAKWKLTLTSAQKANALPEIVQSIQQLQERIAETRKPLLADLNDLYSLQVQVAQQADRATTGAAVIDKAVAAALTQLFQQTHPAMWNAASFATQGTGAAVREKASLGEQMEGVRAYLAPKTGALLIHAFLFALLIAACCWIRNVIHVHAQKEEGLRDAERIFNVPFSTALLIALLASNWLYPPSEAPRLLWAGIGAVALIPTVVIMRRLISVELLPLLYATVVAYLIDQVRYAATPAGVFSRFVLLVELLAVCIFLLAALRSKRLCVTAANPGKVEKVVRAYLHTAFFVFLAGDIANFLGYVPLAFLIGNGMLEISYLAVIFYAAVRILDALALAAMSLRPINRFGMVRHNHDLVYEKTTKVIRWIAVATWIVAALQIFSLRNPVWEKAGAVLATEVGWGSMHIQIGAIIAFPITVWAAFALSRLIRFALQEDVYPNLNLPRGIPYAISTMVHYTILVVGFFVALDAMGINLSNYAVLAGAFGVGLGFGLQNIMNNFVSGLILLFERPIKIGDTVQIDANTIGRVERIGIRASVILLTNGSELIMPNGNLISNPVTNWTLSNCERLIEIPVSIAPKANARRALEILVEIAKDQSAVLKNPSPQAVIVTLAAASTSLKLRCWVDAEEDWMKVTSELSLELQSALEKENIALA